MTFEIIPNLKEPISVPMIDGDRHNFDRKVLLSYPFFLLYPHKREVQDRVGVEKKTKLF